MKQGGKDYGIPIIISEVHEGSPSLGVFRPGDIVLTVNFVDITDMHHDDAVTMLTNLVSHRKRKSLIQLGQLPFQNGSCRFGVIHLKTNVQYLNQYKETESSDDSVSHHLSPPLSTSLEIDKQMRCYYRSVVNSFIMLPMEMVESGEDVGFDGSDARLNNGVQSDSTLLSTSSSSLDDEEEEQVEDKLVVELEVPVSSKETTDNHSKITPSKMSALQKSSHPIPGCASRMTDDGDVEL